MRRRGFSRAAVISMKTSIRVSRHLATSVPRSQQCDINPEYRSRAIEFGYRFYTSLHFTFILYSIIYTHLLFFSLTFLIYALYPPITFLFLSYISIPFCILQISLSSSVSTTSHSQTVWSVEDAAFLSSLIMKQGSDTKIATSTCTVHRGQNTCTTRCRKISEPRREMVFLIKGTGLAWS
jgi:hypothetical protein